MKFLPKTAYAAALLAVLLGWIALAIVKDRYGPVFAFAPFLPAAMIAAWLGGLAPTLFTVAISCLIVIYFFLAPGSLILSAEMMLRHMGWREAADLIIKSMETAIGDKVVTYDFARLMEGATEVKCSAFGQAMIDRM